MQHATADALAAVAVAGAASAQVTLSGKLAYGWETASNPAGVTTSKGLKVTDGNFTLAATEDLGGGLKMAAKMDIQSRGRGTDIAGRDASLTLSGGFGALTIGAVEYANGILDLGGAGAPTIGLDNNSQRTVLQVGATPGSLGSARVDRGQGVLDSATDVDILAYALPVGNGLTLTVMRTDATDEGEGDNPGTTYGVEYSAGALSAKLDRTSATLLKRTSVSASYDLGMATIGYGYQTVKATTDGLASGLIDAGTNKQSIVGVAVPMGAWTFGVNYGTNKNTGAATPVDNTGTDLGVSYALSKRTTFYVQNQRVKVGNNAASKTTRVKLMHTF